jgi:hypothetical protein
VLPTEPVEVPTVPVVPPTDPVEVPTVPVVPPTDPVEVPTVVLAPTESAEVSTEVDVEVPPRTGSSADAKGASAARIASARSAANGARHDLGRRSVPVRPVVPTLSRCVGVNL